MWLAVKRTDANVMWSLDVPILYGEYVQVNRHLSQIERACLSELWDLVVNNLYSNCFPSQTRMRVGRGYRWVMVIDRMFCLADIFVGAHVFKAKLATPENRLSTLLKMAALVHENTRISYLSVTRLDMVKPTKVTILAWLVSQLNLILLHVILISFFHGQYDITYSIFFKKMFRTVSSCDSPFSQSNETIGEHIRRTFTSIVN